MKSKSLSDLQFVLSDHEKKNVASENEKREKQMQDAKEKISNLSFREKMKK